MIINCEKVDKFLVYKVNNERLYLTLDDIVYFESDGNYIVVFFHGKKKKELIRCSIAYLSKILPSDSFVLIHRAFIVNVNFIDEIDGVHLRIDGHCLPFPHIHRKELLSKIIII